MAESLRHILTSSSFLDNAIAALMWVLLCHLSMHRLVSVQMPTRVALEKLKIDGAKSEYLTDRAPD